MVSLLLIGLLFGMRHALEADHVAAVASMVNGEQSLSQAMRQGGMWGLGHTITLFIFGSVVIWMDAGIPEKVASGLEAAVGIMLVGLGLDVIRRLRRRRIHFHRHRHQDGSAHFHAHSHSGEPHGQHARSSHDHTHPQGFPLRALVVGLMHGMAGSAALIALTLGMAQSPVQGLLYILLYGIGSMLGMALLSVAISVPLRLSARRLTWAYGGFQAALGTASCSLGVIIIYENLMLW